MCQGRLLTQPHDIIKKSVLFLCMCVWGPPRPAVLVTPQQLLLETNGAHGILFTTHVALLLLFRVSRHQKRQVKCYTSGGSVRFILMGQRLGKIPGILSSDWLGRCLEGHDESLWSRLFSWMFCQTVLWGLHKYSLSPKKPPLIYKNTDSFAHSLVSQSGGDLIVPTYAVHLMAAFPAFCIPN